MTYESEFSLETIASWQIDGAKTKSKVVARLPSLQRGAVWEPNQIEIFWDSIMRGFPVGSLTLSEKTEEQKDKKKLLENNPTVLSENTTTHHILDGQQRCNSIALGFANPWEHSTISSDTLLWIDLSPDKDLLDKTSRKYLLRVTTKAHPWGFKLSDNCEILSISDRRNFFEKHNVNERPDNINSTPHHAKCAVPLAFLLKHSKDGSIDFDGLKNDSKLKDIVPKPPLDKITEENLKDLKEGIKNIFESKIFANYVKTKAIEDIEAIFYRLNTQGSPLNSEEIAYSMIKAYWPGIEGIINNINPIHTTEARLVYLGIRVALTEVDDKKLHKELSINDIRKIFAKSSDDDVKKKIENYFNNDLKKSLEWIDRQFLYKEAANESGIPTYLRSSIAWHSKEVFAWLLIKAKEDNYSEILSKDNIKTLAYALCVHWLSKEKEKAISGLLANKKLNTQSTIKPLDINLLEEIFKLDHANEKQLKEWSTFWKRAIVHNEDGEKYSDPEQEKKEKELWPFLKKLQDSSLFKNELIIYSQRKYIENNFSSFDPSNKLMWKGYNRPWDYDHILPSNKLNATGRGSKSGKYLNICKTWQRSIGNLVAVDMSFNRSASDKKNASDKYSSASDLCGSFHNLEAYDMELEDTIDFDKSKKFVLESQKRLLNIYKESYNNLFKLLEWE